MVADRAIVSPLPAFQPALGNQPQVGEGDFSWEANGRWHFPIVAEDRDAQDCFKYPTNLSQNRPIHETLPQVGEGDFFWEATGWRQFPKVVEVIDVKLAGQAHATWDKVRWCKSLGECPCGAWWPGQLA